MTKFLKTSALIAFLLSSFYTIAENSFGQSVWIYNKVAYVTKLLKNNPVQGELERAELCKWLTESNNIKTKEARNLCTLTPSS